MSATATRIPLDVAERLAAWLRHQWAMHGDECAVVGSIRRRCPDIGDVDLIAPMPTGRADPLYDRISASLGLGGGLFAGDAVPKVLGREEQGLKRGFKACRLIIVGRDRREIKVEIQRYTPDNRGWKELMRTGSAEFAEAVLAQWKFVNRIPATKDGSHDGHLVQYSAEHPDTPEVVPMPTERHVFAACHLVYAAPEHREDADGLLSPWWLTSDVPAVRERGRKGMLRLGFAHPVAVTEAFNELRQEVPA